MGESKWGDLSARGVFDQAFLCRQSFLEKINPLLRILEFQVQLAMQGE